MALRVDQTYIYLILKQSDLSAQEITLIFKMYMLSE